MRALSLAQALKGSSSAPEAPEAAEAGDSDSELRPSASEADGDSVGSGSAACSSKSRWPSKKRPEERRRPGACSGPASPGAWRHGQRARLASEVQRGAIVADHLGEPPPGVVRQLELAVEAAAPTHPPTIGWDVRYQLASKPWERAGAPRPAHMQDLPPLTASQVLFGRLHLL